MSRASIAELFAKRQPTRIRSGLVRDAEFMKEIGMVNRSVVIFANKFEVDRQTLVSAARELQVRTRHSTEKIFGLDGREAELSLTREGVEFREKAPKGAEPQFRVLIPELSVLSKNRVKRKKALEYVLEHVGPPFDQFVYLRQEIHKRPLSNEETGELLDRMANSVVAIHNRIASGIANGMADADHLIPEICGYYDRFCGPDPTNLDPEIYLQEKLIPYRKSLLKNSLKRGLPICLLGSLRDDLCPGQWTLEFSDDALWDVLKAHPTDLNPFSLIGALDTALYRQHDDRFESYAKDIVIKLLQPSLPRPDGVDTYGLIAAFTRLTFNRISVMEGGLKLPGYWRRMCAWMHACILHSLTLNIKFESEKLTHWITQQQSISGLYAGLLDLRREPMFYASVMDGTALRGEILGRLLNVRHRHQSSGRQCPLSDEIDKAIHEFSSSQRPLICALPGPLEGHIRPTAYPNRKISDDDARFLNAELDKPKDLQFWDGLARLSQYYALEDNVRSHLSAGVKHISTGPDVGDSENLVHALGSAACLAVTIGDETLAETIADQLLSFVGAIKTHEQLVSLIRSLLIASAVFQDDTKWAAWLGLRLAIVGRMISFGTLAKQYRTLLDELRIVIPYEQDVTSRARANVSAAY